MGTVCGREELTSRLGLEAVQRLAKDGCRLLQNHNYRLPERNQAVSRESLTSYTHSSRGLMLSCEVIGQNVAIWLV